MGIVQVSAYESIISKGKNVGDKQLETLIELLMNQLVKLDGIFADGDVKLKRRTQVYVSFNTSFSIVYVANY